MSSRRHSHSRPHSHHPSHHGHASESGDIHQWLSSVGDRQPTVRAPSVASNAPSRAGSRVGNVLRSVLAHAGLPGPSRAGSRTPTVAGLAPSRAGSRAPTVVNRAPSGAGPPTLSSYHGTPPPSHHGSQPLHLAFDISTQAGSVLSGSARAPSTRAPSTRSQPISCHSLGTSRYLRPFPVSLPPLLSTHNKKKTKTPYLTIPQTTGSHTLPTPLQPQALLTPLCSSPPLQNASSAPGPVRAMK